MPIKPGLGVGRWIRADIAGITMRQIKGKEVGLLFNTTNNNQSFPKVSLHMPRGMTQRHKHLP